MTDFPLHRLAEKAINRPLLLHPDKAAVILKVLDGRLPGIAAGGVDDVGSDPNVDADGNPDATRFFGSRRRANGDYAWNAAQDGVAVIPIIGSLVNRGAWIGASSGLVSYEGLAAQLTEAVNDPEVHSIILDIDSPGGEALGMAGLAAKVREVNAHKPVVAFVDDMAASAAYGIASGASKIVVSETSVVGSIGVVMLHADHSAALDNEGIKVTLIHSGDHKVDGNPFEPLSDDVKADFQAEGDKHYSIFLNTVAAGRGDRLSAGAAKATEARVFIGRDAIKAGLADQVATFAEVVAALRSSRTTTLNEQENLMALHQSQIPSTQADMERAKQNAYAESYAEGVQLERSRIGAILDCREAFGKRKQAMQLALETDCTIDQAKAFLRASTFDQTEAVDDLLSIEARNEAIFGIGSSGPGAGGVRPMGERETTPIDPQDAYANVDKTHGDGPAATGGVDSPPKANRQSQTRPKSVDEIDRNAIYGSIDLGKKQKE